MAHREEGDVEEEASPMPVERADLQERGVERPQQPPLKKTSRRLARKFWWRGLVACDFGGLGSEHKVWKPWRSKLRSYGC